MLFTSGTRARDDRGASGRERRKPRFETLEERRLLNASPLFDVPTVETALVSEAVPSSHIVPGLQSLDESLEIALRQAGQNPSALSQNFVFNLNSDPNSNKTIYLDFNGHTYTGSSWNNGAKITVPPFDTDGNASTFSNAELRLIYEIWARVAEDYAPFEVNVTTKAPSADQLTKTPNINDETYGIRVAVGGSCNDWYVKTGTKSGVAEIGSFNASTDVPCFVWSKTLAQAGYQYFGAQVADSVSHEVGHSLGLAHDGKGSEEYYLGADGWAPLMGAAGVQPLSIWSNGDYDGATNREDDLAVIVANNGFGYRDDDCGDSFDQAQRLTFSASGNLGSGTIERNTDVDFFSFALNGEASTLVVGGLRGLTNLDALVKIYDSNRELVGTYDPKESLYVRVDLTNFAPGEYYMSVEGTGLIRYGELIYSDYGSLGAYAISTIPTASAPGLSEPNDNMTDAYPLGPIAGTKVFTSKIDRADDEDWYSFTLLKTGTANDSIKLTAQYYNSSNCLTLQLLDEKSELDRYAFAQNVASVSLNGLAPGTYYFRVYDAYNSATVNAYRAEINAPGAMLETPTLELVRASATSATAAVGAVAGASKYKIEYSTDKFFRTGVKTISLTSAGSKTIAALTAGETYYFRARAVGNETTFFSSDWIVREIAPTLPSQTTLAAPTVASISTNANSATFTVAAVPNATAYLVEYSTVSSFQTSTSKTFASSGSKTISGLTPNTKYYFRVKATATGFNDSEWTQFDATTQKATLTAPGIAAKSTTDASASFTIGAVANANKYVVQYGTDENFESPATKSFATSGSQTISGLTPNTKYYFRVKATATGFNDSEWTTFNLTTKKTTLPVPTVRSISTTETSASFVVGAVANANKYVVQYGTDENFQSPASITFTSRGTQTISDLTPNAKYYFRVKASAAGFNDSPWTTFEATTQKATLTAPEARVASATTTALYVEIREVDDAAKYVLQYDLDPNFPSPKEKTYSAPGKRWITNLTPRSTYYFRVKATADEFDDSVWTNFEGTTKTPTLATPKIDAISVDETVVSFNLAPVPSAERYLVEFAPDSNFSRGASVSFDSPGEKTIADLEPNSTYYFRVKAIADNYNDSPTASFAASTFNAKERLEIQEGCDALLSPPDEIPEGAALYWNLSNKPLDSLDDYVPADPNLVLLHSDYPASEGRLVARIRIRDAQGAFGDSQTAVLNFVRVHPTIEVKSEALAEGSVLRLDLTARFPMGESIALWTLDWGDGTTTTREELGTELIATHFYQSQSAKTTYKVKISLVDETGFVSTWLDVATFSPPVSASEAADERGPMKTSEAPNVRKRESAPFVSVPPTAKFRKTRDILDRAFEEYSDDESVELSRLFSVSR